MRATLVFEDESGISLVCPLKRTWAPRGQTPKLRTSLQHNQRINVIGALLITPAGRKVKLRAKRHEVNLTGEQIIDFLKHLLRRVRGPILLVMGQSTNPSAEESARPDRPSQAAVCVQLSNLCARTQSG